MVKALSAQPDVMRGLVRVAAQGAPAGNGVLTRRTGREVAVIRGGTFPITTGGVIVSDAEALFGTDITYRLVDTVTDRYLQSNRVLNPKAANDTSNVATGPSRVLARETDPALAPPRDAATSFRVPPYATGSTYATVEDRTLLSLTPSGFGPGRWYVSGQLRYDSPDIWLWDDVRTAGTWQTIKNKGTWQDVKAANSPLAGQPFANLYATVLGSSKTTAERRRNRIKNPRGGTNTSSWTVNAGTGGTAAVTQQAAGGPDGGTFIRATWSVANTAIGGQLRYDGRAAQPLPMAVTPGQVISAAAQVRASLAQRLALVIAWFDAAGVAIGSPTTVAGSAQAVTANTWTRLINEGVTVPAGAAYALVGPQAVTGTGAVLWPVGATLDASQAVLTVSSTIGTYFDGSTAAVGPMTYTWSGTAHVSEAIETVLDYVPVVAPFQILGVQTGDNGGWATFQGIVDVPVGAPAGARLVFLQGTVTREWTVTWWLSTLMVCPEAESLKAGALLPYFDGDSPLAAKAPNPAENLAPGYDWKALTGDASITWQGTPNASWSQFTGPSQIFAEVSAYIGKPDRYLLPRTRLPVFLSDPVAPQLAQWFELVEIGDLSYAARQQLFDVLGRGAAIAVNQKRGWAVGELRLMTYTLPESEIAERLFESGRILYWRNPDPRYPENGWWVAIGDTASGRVGAAASWAPERLWRVPFARVERPAGLISATSSVTWAVTRTNYTWQQLRDAKKDWLDAALTGPGASA